MNSVIILLLVLVGLLYIKWIIVILFMPIQFFNGIGKRCRNKTISFVMRAPYSAIQLITNGGCERFTIYTMSTFPSCTIRKLYYRIIGCDIDSKVVFHFKTEIRAPWSLTVGKGTIIGDNAILDARSGLRIGRNVNLSSNVSIYTLQHNHRSKDFDCEFDRDLSVDISDRVWLGSNVIVLPGVKIGEGAVVCAGAVVTKDIVPFAVVAGIPAKQVGVRPNDISYEFSGKTCWFY